MSVVVLDRLTKIYDGGAPAADAVSLTVEDGEFMVLLGPSGCGKSTTLRMVAGLESISDGTLTIDGKVMNGVPAKDRDIAMVFQSYALYPHMKVRDNLAFGLKRRGVPRAQVATRVEEVAATLGLTDYLDRKPHALSGGQRQRVALGRAIVRDPDVFLFDEPLSNLDAALRVSTRSELIKLHKRLGATVIYVTHDQVEAMTMGSRICIMQAGRVVQIGAPMDVYRNPANAFVARFLGSPPMNLAPAVIADGAIRAGAIAIPIGQRWAAACSGRREIVFGIRPEHLAPADPAAADGDTVSFAATVAAVEPMGAETLLVLSVDGLADDLVAKVDADCAVRFGDRIDMALDVRRAHLFDSETTRAIA